MIKTTIKILFLFVICFNAQAQQNNYEIGLGISDVTGQIAETNFFGYGDPFFSNAGIRDRQYSRAYIVQEPGERPFVYVSVDKGGIFQSINAAVLDKLEQEYGDLYQDDNVVLTATHTHVSPGGYSYYQLYDLSVGGFYKKNFDIMVEGIVESIRQAHDNLAPGRIYYNTGELYNASINRSLVAYNLNPESEELPSIDPEMTVLKFVQGEDEVGMISFFGVHPTNLTKEYKHCSGDNKGYAALKFEKLKGATYQKNTKTFVAAFSNTNAGDMSPNLNLPEPGDNRTPATGPGSTEEESSDIIGHRQFEKALELYNTANKQIFGNIDFVTRYTDMSNVEVEPQYTGGETEYTCIAAYGTSFRAGAEDGRSGIGSEGETRNPWFKHSALDVCHMEKNIDPLFILGYDEDNPRSPKIIPSTIVKLGQVALLAGPGEFTITSGRRIKNTVAKYDELGLDHLVFVGYSDAYAGYVTSREEYSSQQYEGASTHFGPWTLAAYLQTFDRLAQKMIDPSTNPWNEDEPEAPKMKPFSKDKTPYIVYDNTPWFKNFGDVKENADRSYSTGDEVEVKFWGAHPNNNTKVNDTYLEVQRKTSDGWVTEYTDRDVVTKLTWKRSGVANSIITINWDITEEAKGGQYRIVNHGDWKNGWSGRISPYTGVSRTFTVNQTSTNFAPPVQREINDQFSVYPSITNRAISLVNPTSKDVDFEVVSSLGQVISAGHVHGKNTTQVNIEGSTGIYFVRFNDERGVVFQTKIIKQ